MSDSVINVMPGSGHDFSQIRVHRTEPEGIQTKLAVNQPGDSCEQEADRVAEQLVGLTTADASMALAEPDHKQEGILRREEVSGTNTGGITDIPPVVDDVLRDSGQSLDEAERSFMEPRFGHDFSRIRIHSDSRAAEAAQAVNALAYTIGPNIVFGRGAYTPETDPGKYLLAHELTHVVQQGVVQPLSKAGKATEEATPIGAENDLAEAEAHAGAHRVMRSEELAHRDVSQANPASVIRRFVSREHEEIGDEALGAGTTTINYGTLTQPKYLTYGEMVALAGDYFKDLDEMRGLATQDQNGRDQIRYAREKALNKKDPAYPNVTPDVIKAVNDRYNKLATQNITHFSAGGTARNEYEKYHEQALQKAFDAGVEDDEKLWAEALTIEAFGCHFLTDMFSAGHVRTARSDVRYWYQLHYLDSIPQFVSYMARKMNFILRTKILLARPSHALVGLDGDSPVIEKQIYQLGGEALKGLSLGDIVSIALHDADSESGLHVASNVDVGLEGEVKYTAQGDERLTRDSQTWKMVVAAVRTSRETLDDMREAGRAFAWAPQQLSHSSEISPRTKAYIAALANLKSPVFGAERFIPHEDTTAGNVSFNWQWGSFNHDMWKAVDTVVKGFIVNKLLEIADAQTDDTNKKLLVEFAQDLKEEGIGALEKAISVPAGGK